MFGLRKRIENILPKDAVPFFLDIRSILQYSAGKMTSSRGRLVSVAALKLVAFLLGLSMIYITKLTLDKGLLAKDLKLFFGYTALGFMAFVLLKVFSYAADSILEKVRHDFSLRVNYDMTDRFFGLDYLSVKNMTSSENSFVMQYDHASLENLVFMEIISLSAVFKIPAYFVMGFLMSPSLTLLVLVALPFVAAHTLWASRKRKGLRGRELYFARKHHAVLHDAILNLKLIKSMGKELWATENIVSAFRKKVSRALKGNMFSMRSRTLGNLLSKGATVAYCLLGGYLIIRKGLSFGSFSAVSIYLGMILSETANVGMFIEGLYSERSSIKRCAAFVQEVRGKRQEARGKGQAFPERSDIAFDDVSFAYPGRGYVLKEASFSIPEGTWCWIKGISGVGKTTLLSLLLRLFAPDRGKVTIGGVALGDIQREDFYDRISVVHQDPYLFNDTILNNVLMGHKIDKDHLQTALKVSGADELVRGSPLGYNTRVGEYGNSLSGGQKQRISIARALVREPELLILDEATSFIDAVSEKSIFAGIKEKFPESTVIFVTHRDTVSEFADIAFTLRDKQLVAEEFCGYNEKGSGEIA